MGNDHIRLVIVDDEARFREAISKRLDRRGIRVRAAGNGPECLSLLEESPADVVVSDVKMPGMDGLALLQQIRERYPDTQVILLTGHATTADGVAGIKSGAFDYLTKPVEFDHLLSKIRQAHETVLWQEERRKEAEFREKVEQQMIITERLAALGTLATGVAHEINNPLAIIRESAGWLGLILAKEKDMPRRADVEKALDKIEKGVERARRITHQLLGFVQKNESVAAEVDLDALAEESLQLVAREAVNKEISITKETESGNVTVFTDPYQIRQVLLNLITNAIHATGKGGRITLGMKKAGDAVCITVADTGEGIPRENLKKIFEPFFTTKSPGKGTGLGLFVTRSILERLGGTMEVESQVGKGTVFTVCLPRYGKGMRR
jgi:signal transduction histidine kinase